MPGPHEGRRRTAREYPEDSCSEAKVRRELSKKSGLSAGWRAQAGTFKGEREEKTDPQIDSGEARALKTSGSFSGKRSVPYTKEEGRYLGREGEDKSSSSTKGWTLEWRDRYTIQPKEGCQ